MAISPDIRQVTTQTPIITPAKTSLLTPAPGGSLASTVAASTSSATALANPYPFKAGDKALPNPLPTAISYQGEVYKLQYAPRKDAQGHLTAVYEDAQTNPTLRKNNTYALHFILNEKREIVGYNDVQVIVGYQDVTTTVKVKVGDQVVKLHPGDSIPEGAVYVGNETIQIGTQKVQDGTQVITLHPGDPIPEGAKLLQEKKVQIGTEKQPDGSKQVVLPVGTPAPAGATLTGQTTVTVGVKKVPGDKETVSLNPGDPVPAGFIFKQQTKTQVGVQKVPTDPKIITLPTNQAPPEGAQLIRQDKVPVGFEKVLDHTDHIELPANAPAPANGVLTGTKQVQVGFEKVPNGKDVITVKEGDPVPGGYTKTGSTQVQTGTHRVPNGTETVTLKPGDPVASDLTFIRQDKVQTGTTHVQVGEQTQVENKTIIKGEESIPDGFQVISEEQKQVGTQTVQVPRQVTETVTEKIKVQVPFQETVRGKILVSRELDQRDATGAMGDLLTQGTQLIGNANQLFNNPKFQQYKVTGLLGEDNQVNTTAANLVDDTPNDGNTTVQTLDNAYLAGDPTVGGLRNNYQGVTVDPAIGLSDPGFVTLYEDGAGDSDPTIKRKITINSRAQKINSQGNEAFTQYGFVISDDAGKKYTAEVLGGQAFITDADGNRTQLLPGQTFRVGSASDPVAQFSYQSVAGGKNGTNEPRLVVDYFEKPTQASIDQLVAKGADPAQAAALRSKFTTTLGFRVPAAGQNTYAQSGGVGAGQPLLQTPEGVLTYYDAHFYKPDAIQLDTLSTVTKYREEEQTVTHEVTKTVYDTVEQPVYKTFQNLQKVTKVPIFEDQPVYDIRNIYERQLFKDEPVYETRNTYEKQLYTDKPIYETHNLYDINVYKDQPVYDTQNVYSVPQFKEIPLYDIKNIYEHQLYREEPITETRNVFDVPQFKEVPIYETQDLYEVPKYKEQPVYDTRKVYNVPIYQDQTKVEKKPIYETQKQPIYDVTGYDIQDVQYFTCPLALDLDGDGLETTQPQKLFDINGDGKLDQTAWFGAREGILAFDADGNGIAGESGKELLGAASDIDGDGQADHYANGFEALKAFARKNLGEAALADGVLDKGELDQLESQFGLRMIVNNQAQKLSDYDIQKIQLNYQDTATEDANGNLLKQQGSFDRKINGDTQTLTIYDAYLKYQTSQNEAPETAAMPAASTVKPSSQTLWQAHQQQWHRLFDWMIQMLWAMNGK